MQKQGISKVISNCQQQIGAFALVLEVFCWLPVFSSNKRRDFSPISALAEMGLK